ncbi:uncharacterized protein B0H18DRAFT_960562 [Fomitopsis serialis]|uniref:uncharacterized protein n=1 Tax=Fomitopsis serialis TaxID=139415 RepID=UPI0020083DE4|nr:uncharacterized protein B0H18DRAFT_960562 [Neoantrodia serialis]KAH9913195.1 hypothetical protein B0H18DRAFT_960562 [Neoantrodia serialis]
MSKPSIIGSPPSDAGTVGALEWWFERGSEADLKIFDNAKTLVEQTRRWLRTYGIEYGVYSRKRAEPTWITVELSKLAGRVKNRTFNKVARYWVKAEWPELLIAGQSHWPGRGLESRGKNLQDAEEPLSGRGDNDEGGQKAGDEDETDTLENRVVESAKDVVRAKAEECRKRLKKCDYCRSATRAVRECVVDQDSGTCGTCRKAGKGCYFQGYSLNGTQNKNAATLVTPDDDASSTVKKGKRKAASVTQVLEQERPAKTTASVVEETTLVQRETRSRALRQPSAAKLSETALDTATKTRGAKNGRLMDERSETPEEAPPRKRGRYDVEKPSNATQKRPTRATAAAPATNADRRASRPSNPVSDGHIQREPSQRPSDAASIHNVNIDGGNERRGELDDASDSAGEAAGDHPIIFIGKVIKLCEAERAKVAKKMEKLQKHRIWLDAQLKANKTRLRELQQAQMAEAGPSHQQGSSP